MDHMIHHVSATARGVNNALVLGDMPIHSYDTVEQAVDSARKLHLAGAHAVKLEGGVEQKEKIAAIVKEGIPVIGHLGLLPQSILKEGGYKIKGKTDKEIQNLLADLAAIEEAGVCATVIEGTVPEVAELLTKHSTVPTLGIGSGDHTCDGDVVVIHDIVGAFPWFVPGFVKPKADVAGMMSQAVKDWMKDVYTHPKEK